MKHRYKVAAWRQVRPGRFVRESNYDTLLTYEDFADAQYAAERLSRSSIQFFWKVEVADG